MEFTKKAIVLTIGFLIFFAIALSLLTFYFAKTGRLGPAKIEKQAEQKTDSGQDSQQYIPLDEWNRRQCRDAKGKITEKAECDGSKSEWCVISEQEQCYPDYVRDGKCIAPFGEVPGPKIRCDAKEEQVPRNDCTRAGGSIVKQFSCKGNVYRVCKIAENDQCYLDQIKNGKCSVQVKQEEIDSTCKF